MQLGSNSVHFDFSVFVKLACCSYDLDLEWDLLSELVSVWTAEAENKLVDFVLGASSWKNCDRNSHLEVFLTFDFKVDWHVDELDRHAFKVDRLVHAEEAALLPRPVS